MNIILLPGNSIESNKLQFEEIISQINQEFPNYKVKSFEYEHWKTKGEQNMPSELNKVSQLTKEGEYVFLAKSYGSVIALESLKSDNPKPTSMLLLGVPVNPSEKEAEVDLKYILSDTEFPIRIIQQKNDKYIPSQHMRKFLDKYQFPNVSLLEIEGGDHKYSDLELILNELGKIIK